MQWVKVIIKKLWKEKRGFYSALGRIGLIRGTGLWRFKGLWPMFRAPVVQLTVVLWMTNGYAKLKQG